ncbi:MAG: amino acid ABC transporter ATP-binding protein [Bacilli bacterium]|nr:amino acid ABC transporter ATP-binding protein [Bacilli bacterium]MDD4795304.1 amino acid ABC transporter ATP-binding protein [Bacilli bacterium]
MLEVKNVVKKFGDITALDHINLKVKKGEKIVVIGPSGCGKSTLLRCINLLETPTSGTIKYEGVETINIKRNHLSQKIGMIFQSYNLFNHLTIIKNITLVPIKLKLMTKEEAYKKAYKLLDEMKLKDKAGRYPRELSGGEKQRIAIIRSLILEPEVLLIDEPTGALDPENIKDVLKLLEDISDTGMTMVVVTHEMNFASHFADRVVFMEHGKIIIDGDAKEIFVNPKNVRLKEFLSKIRS